MWLACGEAVSYVNYTGKYFLEATKVRSIHRITELLRGLGFARRKISEINSGSVFYAIKYIIIEVLDIRIALAKDN
jgi:hypothetical protein